MHQVPGLNHYSSKKGRSKLVLTAYTNLHIIRFQVLRALVSESSPQCLSCSVTSTTYATMLVEMTNRIGLALTRRCR